MIELAPAYETPTDAYCPRCAERGAEGGDWLPLEHDANDATTPRTLPVPSDHIQDMGRLFDGAVPVYAVVCDRHDLACLHANGARSGWVIVRLQTDNGLARAWAPEAEIDSHPAEDDAEALVPPCFVEDPEPDPPDVEGYGHVVELGDHNYETCDECGDDAAVLARAPPEPDAVDHPRGAFLCADCADA
jgi:hypothetical protein